LKKIEIINFELIIYILVIILFLPYSVKAMTAGEAGDSAWNAYMQQAISNGEDPNNPTVQQNAHYNAAGAYMAAMANGASTSPMDSVIDQLKTQALAMNSSIDSSRIPAELRTENINSTAQAFEQRVVQMYNAGGEYQSVAMSAINMNFNSPQELVSGLSSFYNSSQHISFFKEVLLPQIGKNLKNPESLQFNFQGMPLEWVQGTPESSAPTAESIADIMETLPPELRNLIIGLDEPTQYAVLSDSDLANNLYVFSLLNVDLEGTVEKITPGLGTDDIKAIREEFNSCKDTIATALVNLSTDFNTNKKIIEYEMEKIMSKINEVKLAVPPSPPIS